MTLLLGAFAALGFLTLGVLELLWPTGARRAVRPRTAFAGRLAPVRRSKPLAPQVSPARLIALVEHARAQTDSDKRTAALRVAILTLERWRALSDRRDEGVMAALERARAELWEDYQRIALRRLAASSVPWRASALRVDAAP